MEKEIFALGDRKVRSALYPENYQGILRNLKKHGNNVSR